MPRKFKVISGRGEALPEADGLLSPEEEFRHFRNVSDSVVQKALDTWAELWNELQGAVTHGILVSPEVQRGFEPRDGWPEFLEKMWLLKHYLDYVKRFCQGKA